MKQRRSRLREVSRTVRSDDVRNAPSCHKMRYVSRARAAKVAAKRVAIGDEDYLRPYKCPRCGAWHLTSKAER